MTFWLILGCGLALYLSKKLIKKSSATEHGSSLMSSSNNNSKVELSSPIHIDTSDDQTEANLATFVISYGDEVSKSHNEMKGRWIRLGEAIVISGHTITKGNFYYGGQLNSLDGYGTEASLVDESLKVVNEMPAYEDESIGYWPAYNAISDKCRGAFLNWLSGDRKDPTANIGYVFIYFYGLERRVVVDSINSIVDDAEFRRVFDEIIRIKNTYGSSRSLLSYSIRLLEVMCYLRPNVVSHAEFEQIPRQDSILLKYRIAKTVDEGKPIDANLALAWLKSNPIYNLKKPARRCVNEFNQLFSLQYKKKYSEGIVVEPNKNRLKIEYFSASSTLRGVEIPQENLPDPSNLRGPSKKLIEIADNCTEALDSYSRYLGKSGTSRSDVTAGLLLPDELEDLGLRPGLKKFKAWALDKLSTENGIVNVREFWEFTNAPVPERINKKESGLIQLLAEKSGFGIAPDTRYHHAKLSIDGSLVLFADGHGRNFKPSGNFKEMGMKLRLGAMVATIDSHLDVAEVALLEKFIDQNINLSPVEKYSLHAYLLWRLNTPSNMVGLKSRVDALDGTGKEVVRKILVEVAVADGKIDPSEVKQIEKIYTLLGLDKALVTNDIYIHTVSDVGNSPVEFPQEESNNNLTTGFKLDESALADCESQTNDVQKMLSEIFLSEEVTQETPAEEYYDIEEEDLGIDAQHYALYERLISRDRWGNNEMDELCNTLGIMRIGAIEIINDWSFEKVDAPVLEEEFDSIYVDQEIVEELEG